MNSVASAGADGGVLAYQPEQLAGLPAPAVRYFEFALTPGQPIVRRARITWAGEFRTGADRPWKPFIAVQHYTTRPPGFVWDAKIRVAPLLSIRVRDAYIAGEGAMLGKLAALVRVVDQRGTPEMSAGALSRYLAEAVWLPTALLPSQGVVWTPIDDQSARASLTDGRTRVSIDVHFGAAGQIAHVSTVRDRDVHGSMRLTPWVGRFDAYVRTGGMMIPTGGEAEWVRPEGPAPYWRGHTTHVEYDVGA